MIFNNPGLNKAYLFAFIHACMVIVFVMVLSPFVTYFSFACGLFFISSLEYVIGIALHLIQL